MSPKHNAKQIAVQQASAHSHEAVSPGRWTIWSVATGGPVRVHIFGGWLVALATGSDTMPVGATWVILPTESEGVYHLRGAHYGDTVCAGKCDANLKASSRLIPTNFRIEAAGEGTFSVKQAGGDLVWTVAGRMEEDQALLHIALKPYNGGDAQKFHFVPAMISPPTP
ncbi:hypothetical protein AURDEDRAFT_153719 [Auricularia subglabra TFB-10046 SS5]|nr:hypothetical protein AURDEDRAFT_153719 [Auricularia subglabra TFB-10046 SS5]